MFHCQFDDVNEHLHEKFHFTAFLEHNLLCGLYRIESSLHKNRFFYNAIVKEYSKAHTFAYCYALFNTYADYQKLPQILLL